MSARSGRVLAAIFGITWLGAVALAVYCGAMAAHASASQLAGLLVAVYLALWGWYFSRSRHGATGNAARFLACTTSIVAALVVLETAALLSGVDYRRVFLTPTEPWERPRNRPDPALLYVRNGPRHIRRRLVGNDIATLAGGKDLKIHQCNVRYDQKGFRNASEMSSADVIVLGDSFIEGSHVSDAELVTAQLQALLSRTVANLGRIGDGPQQELAVLRRYGLGLQPRTCVWSFYEGNDLRDSQEYELNQAKVRRYSERSRLQLVSERSFTRNCLEYLIRTWLDPRPRPPARLYAGRFESSPAGPLELFFGSDDYYDQDSKGGMRDQSPELGRVHAVLAQAHELCRRHGIDLVVVFIPTKFRVYHDLCHFDHDSPCLSWPADGLPNELAELVGQVSTEIGYVDLTPRFRAAAAHGSLVYLPDDTHWTSEGHRLAANAIGECLKSRPALTRPALADRPLPPASRR
jgi:SGNH hydrolase-like domain, acetyltransferase AlgX